MTLLFLYWWLIFSIGSGITSTPGIILPIVPSPVVKIFDSNDNLYKDKIINKFIQQLPSELSHLTLDQIIINYNNPEKLVNR